MTDSPRSDDGSASLTVSTRVYLLLVLTIGLVGLLLRVVDLEAFPAGLHFDQAANGLLALQIVAGQRPVFFPSYTGREALFMYVIAGLFQLLGPNLLALRLAGALVGAATVVGLAFLGSALFGRRVGLLASAFLAGLYWHLHVSRLAERTIMVPFLDVLALLALWLGFKRRSLPIAAMGGAIVALQLYTYPSSRFFVVAVLSIGVVELVIGPHSFSSRGRGRRSEVTLATVALLAALIVLLPLALYFRANPGDFLGRADQVAIWNQADGALPAMMTSVRRTLGMFFFLGDQDWKYNLAGQPVFDPITSLFFLGGLGVAIWRIRDRAARVGLIWGGCMLGPGFLSVDAPQFMRTLGAAPAAVLLAALGLDAAVSWLSGRWPTGRRFAPALWGWPVLAAALTAYRYFAIWGPSPAAYLALEGDVTAAATVLRDEGPRYQTTYIASRYGANPTLYFLAGGDASKARWFDGRAVLPLPGPGSSRTLYLLPRTATNVAWYRDLPQSDLVAKILAPDTGPAVEAFSLDATTSFPNVKLAPVTTSGPLDFGGIARLVEASVPASAQQGQTISPIFAWQVESVPAAPLKFFVHLVDATGQTWAQYDEEMYPTSEWIPGQEFLVRYPFTIPEDAAPVTYRLQVGIERADGRSIGINRPAPDQPGNYWSSSPIAVSRSTQPPRLATLDLGRPLDVQFADRARLVGVDLTTTKVQDGDNVGLTLFWQVTGAFPAGAATVVQATNASGGVFSQIAQPADNGIWPATDWHPGDVVVDREQLLIPAGTPPGPVTLSVGLRELPDRPLIPIGQDKPVVPIGTVAVQTRPRAAVTVVASNPFAVAFADPIRLVGYDLQPASARPGESIQLRLYWQADQPILRSWTVFTHVLDAQSQIHAQEDSVPEHGNRPTTTWAPGETIVDSHTLVVQAGTPPGADQIELGLYDASSSARLKTATGDDRVLLPTAVTVLP